MQVVVVVAASSQLGVEEVAAGVVAVAVVEVALGLGHQMLLQEEVARNVKETPFSFKISPSYSHARFSS